MTESNFMEIYPDGMDAEICEGYFDGCGLSNPEPGPNRHPFYMHGFFNGRDDKECSMGIRKFPRKTAQQRREDLSYIVSVLEDQ